MDFYSGFAVVISGQKSLIRPGAFIGMGCVGARVPAHRAGLLLWPQSYCTRWCWPLPQGHESVPQWLSQTPQARSKLVPGAACLLGCCCPEEKVFSCSKFLTRKLLCSSPFHSSTLPRSAHQQQTDMGGFGLTAPKCISSPEALPVMRVPRHLDSIFHLSISIKF